MSTIQNGNGNESEVRYIPVQVIDGMSKSGQNERLIDIVELFKTLRRGRKTILLWTVVFLILGSMYAYFSPRTYTSNMILLPELQAQAPNLGRLGGLVAQLGFGGGGTGGGNSTGEILHSQLYPYILTNSEFLAGVADKKIYYSPVGDSIYIHEYFREHTKINTFEQYTLRLPSTLLRWVRSGFKSKPAQPTDQTNELVSNAGNMANIAGLRFSILFTSDIQTGVYNISVTTQSPEASMQIARHLKDSLSEFLIRYRTERARQNLKFVERRHTEAGIRYMQAQSELAEFRDQNRGVLTATARSIEQNMLGEYNLAFNIYSNLSEQLENARIRVQTDTPLVTTLQEANYPFASSGPNKTRYVIFSVFLGFSIGVFIIIISPFYRALRIRLNEN